MRFLIAGAAAAAVEGDEGIYPQQRVLEISRAMN